MDPSNPQRTRTSSQDHRFHYPQYKPQQQEPSPQQPENSPYAQPSQYAQYAQFPPHPSVRPPPGAKLSARQVPAGVGVARAPARLEPKQERQPLRPDNSGVLIQDFRFPVAPPAPAARSRQDVTQPSPGRKFNMHESYMSSVLDEFGTPAMTPGSRSQGFPTPKTRYSGSVYAESEALGLEERYAQPPYSPEGSRDTSPEPSPQIVRHASVGKRARPAVTTIKNRASQLEDGIPEEASPQTPASRNAAMAALSAAIAAGTGKKPIDFNDSESGSRSYTPVRMPFDASPPTSPSADREFLQTPKSPATTLASHHMLSQAPRDGHSRKSTNPLWGLGIDQPTQAMSNKIPASRRPPKIDIDAVREAEARGSTTSLADLIKRATKLAANLDRGKTASRLGMLDMFGSTEKLNGGYGDNRHSTMSDMISAFPAPAIGGTPTNRRDANWPLGEKGEAFDSTSELSKTKKQRRRCCGLSLPVFIALLIMVVVLIAAAVLIPIFLILVPKQHRNSDSLADCAASFPCQNGGTSIVSNDTCMCICSDGFTGSQCNTAGNAEDCITMTVTEGSNEYNNATIGRSIMPILSPQNRFDIPLNLSTILAVFASSNLSCSSENSLVDFNSSVLNQGKKMKRFIMLPEFEPPTQTSQPPAVDAKPPVPHVTRRAECTGDLRLERRQDGVTIGTSNGIVFQTTSTTIESCEPTGGSESASASDSAPAAASTAAPSGSTTDAENTTTSVSSTGMTDKQVEFAQVVVMYLLQESRTVSLAVNTQQQIETFFSDRNSNSSDDSPVAVAVGAGNLKLSANFDDYTISYANSTIVGGGS